jgi:hypothetical protein
MTGFNSEITDYFSIWVDTILGFLFFKFNREVISGNIFGSGDDGVSTIISLTERENNWFSFEIMSEININPLFHNSVNSTDSQLSSAGQLIGTGFSNDEINIFISVPFIKVFPFFHFEVELGFLDVSKTNMDWMTTIV